MFNTDSYGNIYFPAGVSVGNYPITLNTPTHVLVAGAGGLISKVATSQLISNTDVTSVFGRQGAVKPLPGDYTSDMVKEITNLYFTNERARGAISLTTVGSTGPATYNTVTGVLNVPQYQNDFNGVNSFNTRTGAVTLTALDVTTALTYTPVAIETDPIWGAQKVLYYTKVESDATFSAIGHTHTIANVTGLQTALNGKEPTIDAGTTSQYWRGDKTWQTLPTYTLPTASTTVLGGVKVDGTTITINGSGVISGANTYSLPTATATVLGGVKIGGGVIITSGVISVSTNYEAPITAGTTAQYWRGDKSWQTLPVYTLSGLGGLPLAGGTMTGPITLKEGAANGLKFPNDVFGGSGDTAGMRLIARSGEAMSLEVYLTNDADDWFNISVPNDSAAKVNGNTIWHAGNLTNLNQLTNGPGYITSYTDTNTWDANSKNVAGYVAAPGAVANKVWKTDASGNPAWRDDADTIVTSLAWTSITGRPTALSSFTNDLGNYGSWYSTSGGTISGDVTINGSSNNALTINQTQAYVNIYSTGASNGAGLLIYPTTGYNAIVGNFRGGELVLYAASTDVVYINSNSIRVPKYRFNGNSTLSGNGTAEIIDMANVGMSMQSLNYRWYNNLANVLYMTLDYNGNLTANAFFESSDIRYKDVIETNPNLTLEGLDVIKFTRKGNKIIRYGYSAQQVRSLSEDLVGGTKDELTVNYSDVHTLKIAALEKRIAELEAKLNINGL